MISIGINGLGIANKAGSRPSLNLDFINSQILDPRITFTRASTATRVNANGLIEVVASDSPRIDFDPATDVCKGLLIEEQRTNLLTYSENFDKAVWTRVNATVSANDVTSPDGMVAADKIAATTSASGYVYQQVNISPNTTYTRSIYLKAGTAAKADIGFSDNVNSGCNAFLNFSDWTITFNIFGGWSNPSASIFDMGNGWKRVIFTCTSNSDDTVTTCYVWPRSSGNGNPAAGDYFYAWGAQLEAGSFATSYIPSSDTFTSRASTATYVGSNGLIQSALTNVARYDYNPVNLALAPKLLLESASTNLLTYSEQFDNAVWLKTRSQINSNVIVAPDGTLTADKLVEDTQTGGHHVSKTGYVFTNGTTYCLSVYVQAAERSKGKLILGNGLSGFGGGTVATASYDLIARTCVKSGYADSAGIQQLSGGWFRVWVVGTCTTGAADVVFVSFLDNETTTNYTGDGTSGIYIWGAQLEASSFPTSYIPTVASQVTRAADISSSAQTTRVADSAVMTGTNFSSWYNQTEGTVYFSGDSPPAVTTAELNWAISDATSNNIIFNRKNTANSIGTAITVNAVNQADMADPIAIVGDTAYKSTAAYKLNDIAISTNGGTIFTDTSASIPTVNTLSIGQNAFSSQNLNGHISKLSYYPKRLTNSELQALTTG